jgi:hypothetical protein
MKSAPHASRFSAGSPQRSKAKPQTSRAHSSRQRRDCPHRHQYSFARKEPGRRDGSGSDTLGGNYFRCSSVEELPLAALAGISLHGRLQYERLEEIPEILELSRADIAVWL